MRSRGSIGGVGRERGTWWKRSGATIGILRKCVIAPCGRIASLRLAKQVGPGRVARSVLAPGSQSRRSRSNPHHGSRVDRPNPAGSDPGWAVARHLSLGRDATGSPARADRPSPLAIDRRDRLLRMRFEERLVDVARARELLDAEAGTAGRCLVDALRRPIQWLAIRLLDRGCRPDRPSREERLNKEAKRADAVGILPSKASIVRHSDAVLLGANDGPRIQHRFMGAGATGGMLNPAPTNATPQRPNKAAGIVATSSPPAAFATLTDTITRRGSSCSSGGAGSRQRRRHRRRDSTPGRRGGRGLALASAAGSRSRPSSRSQSAAGGSDRPPLGRETRRGLAKRWATGCTASGTPRGRVVMDAGTLAAARRVSGWYSGRSLPCLNRGEWECCLRTVSTRTRPTVSPGSGRSSLPPRLPGRGCGPTPRCARPSAQALWRSRRRRGRPARPFPR